MNSIKCKSCGLSNFGSQAECRRCGNLLNGRTAQNKRDGKKPGHFSVAALIVYAAIAIGGYLLYSGIYQSVAAVDANDAYRVGAQPVVKTPQPGLSRNEADRQHAAGVGAAIKENPNLTAQKQHNEETQKIMQDASR